MFKTTVASTVIECV